jgi:serine/threonine-protein kinase
MGVVFQGEQLALGRPVAVKILAVASGDADASRKLLLEARALAKLDHPNVVRVYDVGLQEGLFYLVMSLLEGPTLKARVDETGSLPLDEALSLAAGIGRGLDAIHRRGLVHRDLKMENVLLGGDGLPRITDFGLVLDRGARDVYEGAVVGTLPYIPPEVWTGKPADARSDQYSFGILLYALATGRFPFRARTPQEYAELHLRFRPKPAHEANPRVSEEVSAVVEKAMAKKPAGRYASIADCLRDLERAREGRAPDAVTDTGRKLRCGFCEAVNPPGAAKCGVCGEPLGAAASGGLDLGLRDDEMACPLCSGVMPKAARVCPVCSRGVCLVCRKAVIDSGNACVSCAPPKRR